MNRFYFDLTNGESITRDEQGVLAIDLEDAVEGARSALVELRDNVEKAALAEGWDLVIRDESGATLKTLPLA